MKLHTSFHNSFFFKKDNLKYLVIGLAALFIVLIVIFYFNIKHLKPASNQTPTILNQKDTLSPIIPISDTICTFIVPHDVKMKYYFTFIDSLRRVFDTLLPYKLTEYILVRSNPFIIDSLENTDYYRMKLRDSFVYDQKKLVILRKGDILKIPTLEKVDTLKAKMARTSLDINIPEFKLRIIEGGDTIYTFPVRVGQNRTRYLEEVGRDIDLRTLTGAGTIAFVYKKNFFIDPVEGKKFTSTKRDDGNRTLMPLQPWLEPKINGQLRGQLIHPTTNPSSLNKAYSNGCIGTREADIWRIYYYAQIGTKVRIRYDLKVRNENGDTIQLKHIYNPKNMLYL